MENIRIDVGIDTALTVDTTSFSFTGVSKLVFNIVNPSGDVIVTRDFTTAASHTIYISPAESLTIGSGALYYFEIITTDGKRLRNGGSGNVTLRSVI